MSSVVQDTCCSDVRPSWRSRIHRHAIIRRWKARRNVSQYDQADCGPAALLSVLRYWGGNESLPQVRQLSGTDMHGTTLLQLAAAAEQLGFIATGATGSYDDLVAVEKPCIAHLMFEDGREHYVVVYAASAAHVWIGDPGAGFSRWGAQEFQRRWHGGVVLLLEPTPQLARRSPPSTLRWAAGYLRCEQTWIIQSAFLGAVYTAIGLATSGIVHWVVDRFIPGHDRGMLLSTGAVLGGLAVLRVVVGYVRQRFLIRLGTRFGTAITGDFFQHILALPSDFFGTRKKGDVTTRVQDTLRIQGALLRVLGNTVTDAFVILGALAYFFVLAPPLAGVVLGCAFAYAFIAGLGMRGLRARQHAVMRAYAAAEACCIDSLTGC